MATSLASVDTIVTGRSRINEVESFVCYFGSKSAVPVGCSQTWGCSVQPGLVGPLRPVGRGRGGGEGGGGGEREGRGGEEGGGREGEGGEGREGEGGEGREGEGGEGGREGERGLKGEGDPFHWSKFPRARSQ